jgi:hypothetical protein
VILITDTKAILVICLWTNANLFGQNGIADVSIPERLRPKFEVCAGPNLSKMQSEDANIEDYMGEKPGFIVEVGLTQYLSPRFDLAYAISYATKGYYSSTVLYDNDFNPPRKIENKNRLKLGYVIASVLPRLTLGKAKNCGLSAGAYLAVKSSEALDANQYIDGSLSYSYLYKNNLGYGRFDAGVSAEFSYKIPISEKLQPVIKVKWDRGLVDIGAGGSKVFNEVFAILLGTAF